jgi:hypothetical protein
MLDITGPKVYTPSLLFLLLTPGLLLQLPDTLKLFTMRTSGSSVLFHALVFMLAYRTIAKMMKLTLAPLDLIVPAILFVLLSPGMFVTIPQSGPRINSMLVHTLVFAVLFAFLRQTFPQYY